MDKIYSIIVTFNGEKWIDKCINSLKKSSVKVSAIVIDNNSTDNTGAIIKEKYPEVHFIQLNENLGFGKANNLGMRKAMEDGADYVFLLNQDAWVSETNTIENLINAHQHHAEYAIISPVHLYGSGERAIIGKYYIEYEIARENDLFSDLLFKRNLKDIYTVSYVCAASWLLPRTTLEYIGGFDPLFFHYGEDDNYMQRIKYHGFKIGICPIAFICHDIEFRGPEYGIVNHTKEKNLLIELADINNENNIKRRKHNSILRLCQQMVFFRWKSVKTHYSFLKFLFFMGRPINNSRTMNKRLGPNWL